MQSWSTSYTHRAEQIKYYRRDNTKTMGLVFCLIIFPFISLVRCLRPRSQLPGSLRQEDFKLKAYLVYRMSSLSTLTACFDIVPNYNVKRELRMQLIGNSACLACRKTEVLFLSFHEKNLQSGTTCKYFNTNMLRIFCKKNYIHKEQQQND